MANGAADTALSLSSDGMTAARQAESVMMPP
jgi:hypothetical protein